VGGGSCICMYIYSTAVSKIFSVPKDKFAYVVETFFTFSLQFCTRKVQLVACLNSRIKGQLHKKKKKTTLPIYYFLFSFRDSARVSNSWELRLVQTKQHSRCDTFIFVSFFCRFYKRFS
jgi:hypothetical protein